jgi:two-component system phosphate regulon sensor histidine kinase PhoR
MRILQTQMKLNRTYLFITISSLALAAVLIIQINWIFGTAKAKEDLFNEKANLVLSRTTDAMCKDAEMCLNIDECVNMNCGGFVTSLGYSELHKIDSLFKYYLNFYNLHVAYSFTVAQPKSLAGNPTDSVNCACSEKQGCYTKSLDNMSTNDGVELKLIFPEKKQYIIAEMGTMFITSLVLIVMVLIFFWRTISALIKEKKISEHTTDFLNNMTHEFKTPLTNISLAGKMILKNSGNHQENKLKHYSEIILQENEKLVLQVEQVLSMTALERGEIPLQKSEQDFHLLINDALKCMSLQFENKQGIVKLDLKAQNFVVFGDKIHLTNALCNLIDNAIKYSGEKLELYIETKNSENNLIIVISDKGIGIEKEYHRKVFTKFFRVPFGDVHNVKGFGLGLAYIKKIVDLHDGTIKLDSEKGEGTRFTITLPYA